MFETVLSLPFGQDPKKVRTFIFWKWQFYFNRARPCEEKHSSLLHDQEDAPLEGGRFFISHRTKPQGLFTQFVNARRQISYIHRITCRVREDSGVSYLQLIFFSWWVGVVRKDHAQFDLYKENVA